MHEDAGDTREIPVRIGTAPKAATRVIQVDYLARVEGEGSLTVKLRGGHVEDVALGIFEPPRFFEALLRGRPYTDAPDITARICGICPVAYQMSAVHAMENAFGTTITPEIRALRRLLYCGEWLASHALHVYMLHAPDFLGYPDAITMATDHPAHVQRGLALKKAGNEVMRVVGGREIHPVNVRVGGFYAVPGRAERAALREVLLRARDLAEETVRFTAGLDVPDYERDYEFVSLTHPSEYPLNEGRIVSSRGLDIAAGEFPDHFEEIHVARSNALHAIRKEHGEYLVGPLARFALNADRLPPRTRTLCAEARLVSPCRNPFRSIVVRAVEMHFACEEGVRLLDELSAVDPLPAVEPVPRAATGAAATEAPRGLLFHRYRVSAAGLIEDAQIVPPTSQNQKSIETDVRGVVTAMIGEPIERLTRECEKTIRSYDPCISCATHFLRVEVDRA